ncbi:hypothetical protein [Jannaschia rubra]|uniref:Uncharacterized protein n=1 Tax=Jannaschia rubra TaxID=282197 RepID=A0A0M6XLJ3_9RHOB|nr:hypothetical protein [Jannaschia rubra]CTQ32060.1 hypothetical protein JAN5088_00821 [Jannaschia rubra]SFG38596.1 hypothetical protein SAMN04488517_104173 [Jannaschia rubra]
MTERPKPVLPTLRYKNAERALRDLFEEAAADARLDPEASMRSNVITLLAHAWNVSGTIHWQRGWVREAMLVLAAAGCIVPSAQIMRWYRSRISEAPGTFRNTARAPVEILEQMDLAFLDANNLF